MRTCVLHYLQCLQCLAQQLTRHVDDAEVGIKGQVAAMTPTIAFLNGYQCTITLVNNITGELTLTAAALWVQTCAVMIACS